MPGSFEIGLMEVCKPIGGTNLLQVIVNVKQVMVLVTGTTHNWAQGISQIWFSRLDNFQAFCISEKYSLLVKVTAQVSQGTGQGGSGALGRGQDWVYGLILNLGN